MFAIKNEIGMYYTPDAQWTLYASLALLFTFHGEAKTWLNNNKYITTLNTSIVRV